MDSQQQPQKIGGEKVGQHKKSGCETGDKNKTVRPAELVSD